MYSEDSSTPRSHEEIREDTKRLLRHVYRMVDRDECASLESINAGLNAMYGSKMLNKTEAAAFLGIAVSTFDKHLAEGTIPRGVKKRNECLKWSIQDLKAFRQHK